MVVEGPTILFERTLGQFTAPQLSQMIKQLSQFSEDVRSSRSLSFTIKLNGLPYTL